MKVGAYHLCTNLTVLILNGLGFEKVVSCDKNQFKCVSCSYNIPECCVIFQEYGNLPLHSVVTESVIAVAVIINYKLKATNNLLKSSFQHVYFFVYALIYLFL